MNAGEWQNAGSYGMRTGLDPKLMDLNQERKKKKYCKWLIKKSFVPPDVHHYNKDVGQSNIWDHKELEFLKQKIILTSGSRQMPLVKWYKTCYYMAMILASDVISANRCALHRP